MQFKTDGSFIGRQAEVKERSNELLLKVDKELKPINQELRANKTKVSIARKGSSLILKATLPLKPGENHTRDKKQYQISLGIPANLEGCKTAKEEAVILGIAIARHSFSWTEKYLSKKQAVTLTFQEVHDNFEKKYFENNPKNIKSEGTVNKYKQTIRLRFPLERGVTKTIVEDSIKNITSEVEQRRAVSVCNLIFKLFNLGDESFGHLAPKNYKPKKRDIPSDNDIIHWFFQFEEYSEFWDKSKSMWRLYQLWYGLMATYGIRPREAINKPNIDWFLSSENTDNTWKVHELNKTGYREVLPFVPEWVSLFNLKNKMALSMLLKRTQDLNFKQLSILCCQQNRYWRNMGIPFKPYDLRHASAIRAHMQGIPIKLASQNLGHGVEIHTKVYQQWLSLEQRKLGFSEAFNKLDELEKLQRQVIDLKLENEKLKIELEKLKLVKNVQC